MLASEVLEQERVIAVIRADHVSDAAALCAAFVGAGIRCLEITLTVANALDVIGELADRDDCVVGAGTVTTEREAADAMAAGARFLVSPVAEARVVRAGVTAETAVIAGALTPTEVVHAAELGAAAVKIFPARIGGPRYVEDLRGPFPDLRLVPSGGVDAGNAAAYLAAGAFAVATGSSVAPPELVESGDWAEIGRRAEAFVASVATFRQPSGARVP
ncbi:MAG TPA: bifunctional 4-hydroxy-2-oxoglutarate aldolase/2-dehydro-3-deoxy-phosphogluconate aldolase [Solirubrobacteraceae bacterium]